MTTISLALRHDLVGSTQNGRATAFLLLFNEPTRLLQRRALIAQGLYP